MAANTNKACCTIPPVQHTYTAKGSYEQVGGLKTYVVGEPSASIAILSIFDIFGFYPQTLQAADILASAVGARVYMPDFFKGEPFALENFPPDTEEKGKKLQEFFGNAGDFKARGPEVHAVLKDVRAKGAGKVGIIGYCWGAKLALQVASKEGACDAFVQVHPAMVDPADASKVLVPVAFFPSKDEPAEDVEKFWAGVSGNVKEKSVHKTYSNMHHGWAAARADLNDPENKKAYEEVYQQIGDFYLATLA